jgi:hypothetical protein
MARRGRPHQGVELVTKLDASEQARQRLKIILQTLAGTMTVQEACAVLGIGRAAFNKLRQQFLFRATGLLEPRPRGRQRQEPTAAEIELARLKHEVAQLQLNLKAMQVREEIALVMPHLLQRGQAKARVKKTRVKTQRKLRHAGSIG